MKNLTIKCAIPGNINNILFKNSSAVGSELRFENCKINNLKFYNSIIECETELANITLKQFSAENTTIRSVTTDNIKFVDSEGGANFYRVLRLLNEKNRLEDKADYFLSSKCVLGVKLG